MELFALILVCYITGSLIERAHIRSLKAREMALHDLPVLSTKTINSEWQVADSQMVIGSVVISMDYFKRFAAALRNVIGGNVRSMEPLLDRARREAIIRMREQAKQLGAAYVVNVRLEVSRIGLNQRGGATGVAEMLAYGTAIVLSNAPPN